MDDLADHEIDVLLEQLEAEERDISLRRRKLHDRITIVSDSGMREELERREREISKERRELHARIDDLRAKRNELRLPLAEPNR